MVKLSNGGIPLGIKVLSSLCPIPSSEGAKLLAYRIFILVMTFLSYTCYHMSRKPISVVKTEILKCPENETTCSSFITQMNGTTKEEAKRLEGYLDTSYLFSYAFFMFFSGFVAERVDLRYYLSFGMILSGLFTMAFGAAYYLEIHNIAYFIAVQIIVGAFQSTGWPGVVTVVANWFGKGKKGFIFGIWNSHTSFGNIMGSLLAGAFVDESWGLSFIVPGLVIAIMGVVFWLFLVPKPELVNLNLQTDERGRRIPNIPSRGGVVITGEESPLLQSSDESEAQESFVSPHHETQAVTFTGALKIPGVIEFSLCLFFSKLVSYTFLYWLPSFIKETGVNITSESAAYLSTLFDIGGIFGGIIAGFASDRTGKSATICAVMLIFAIPIMSSYQSFGSSCPLDMNTNDRCYYGNIGYLLIVGLFVNGPYALITTAVSAELGTHPSLRGSSKALATVTSIIDGTGSIGAALGPFLAGAIPNLRYIFFMLMGADVFALLFLTRLVYQDMCRIGQRRIREVHIESNHHRQT